MNLSRTWQWPRPAHTGQVPHQALPPAWWYAASCATCAAPYGDAGESVDAGKAVAVPEVDVVGAGHDVAPGAGWAAMTPRIALRLGALWAAEWLGVSARPVRNRRTVPAGQPRECQVSW
jgi:hypothetical protein